MDLAGIDFGRVEASVLANQMAGGAGDEPTERVPRHVRSFYRRMLSLLDQRGIAGDSLPAKALGALALKEQGAPLKPQPFGRKDRQRLKKQMLEEGKIELHKTRRTRGVPAVVDPNAVETAVDGWPTELKSTPEVLTASIGRIFGYPSAEAVEHATRRAHRFMMNQADRRLPDHVRRGMVMSTAVMVATTHVFPGDADPAAVEAVAALRHQFEEAQA